MFPRTATIAVTTDASGDATEYSENVNGQILEVHYTKTDFADGSTITITLERTGETILAKTGINASAIFRPRQTMHDSSGNDQASYAEAVSSVNDRVKIVVSDGGDTKSGSFTIVYG